MSLEDFDIITSRLMGYGKFIFFHVMGEPLLHPKLEDLLLIAENKGFKVNITTNGTLIRDASNTLLKSNALRQVNFSLHSFDANNIDYPIERYLENIADFAKKALSQRELYIALRLWNIEASKENDNNGKILEFLEKSFNLTYNIKEELKVRNSIKLMENLYLNEANKFDWPDMEGQTIDGRAFCYGLRDQIGILSDGSVIPCCLDNEGTITLGNLIQQPLEDILNSQRVMEIFNGFSEGKAVEDLCKRCGYRSRFK